MNYVENLLPIGSIVLLEGGEKTLMIVGYYSVAEGEDKKIYDYTGVLYPEGLTSSSEICFFNHSQIKEIIHEGYKDEAAQNLLNNVKEIVKEKNTKEENK